MIRSTHHKFAFFQTQTLLQCILFTALQLDQAALARALHLHRARDPLRLVRRFAGKEVIADSVYGCVRIEIVEVEIVCHA